MSENISENRKTNCHPPKRGGDRARRPGKLHSSIKFIFPAEVVGRFARAKIDQIWKICKKNCNFEICWTSHPLVGDPENPRCKIPYPPANNGSGHFRLKMIENKERKRASHVDSERRKGRFLLWKTHVFQHFSFKTCHARFWNWSFAKIRTNPLFGGFASGVSWISRDRKHGKLWNGRKEIVSS